MKKGEKVSKSRRNASLIADGAKHFAHILKITPLGPPLSPNHQHQFAAYHVCRSHEKEREAEEGSLGLPGG